MSTSAEPTNRITAAEPVVLAQLSDLHLDSSAQASDRAARVAGYLAGLATPLDAVLVSGDVSDRGEASDYAEARRMLAGLPTPVLWTVGNHDERTAFAAELLDRPGHPPAEPINQVLDLGAVRLVAVDSMLPGNPAGQLAASTLAWLDATLAAAPGMAALVALHHPPVPLGLPRLDPIGLLNPADLAAVLTAHPQVVAVLCGHAHTAASSWFANRPLRVAPAVRSRVVLPWEQPSDRTMSGDCPVALAFHHYAGGVLTTHVRAL